jgi:hypothetical protein
MKMEDAKKIMEQKIGFYVTFEIIDGAVLTSDHFPENTEELIPTEEEAWDLAQKFASKTQRKCVNIYVLDQDFRPVISYSSRMLNRK